MAAPALLFSFFMFTADLRPGDQDYARTIVAHMRALLDMGYAGFDLPIAPTAGDRAAELATYKQLRARARRRTKLGKLQLTTNVAAWPAYDPSSPDPAVRKAALTYLTSRVDITKALGAKIMAGPIVLPLRRLPEDRRWSSLVERRAAELGARPLPRGATRSREARRPC